VANQDDPRVQQFQEIARLWEEAYHTERRHDKTEQALAFGRNFRINIAKALEAAYATTKVIMGAAPLSAGHFAAVDWLGLGGEALHAVTSAFAALVESMLPLNYVACVILSGHPQGLTEDELRTEIVSFLENPKATKLPWYLWMSKSYIRDAKKALKAEGWSSHLLSDLREGDWLIENGSLLKFKPRNFELGFKFS